MSVATETAPFILIDISRLRPETVLSFDLYIQHGELEPVLYRARDMEFSDAVRQRLIDSGVDQLLVPSEQAHAFREYCEEHGDGVSTSEVAQESPQVSPEEQHLPDLLGDAGVPIEERCQTLSSVSSQVVKLALSDLAQPGLSERVSRVAEASARFLMAEPAAFANLVTRFELDFEMCSHLSNTALYTTEFARALGMDAEEMARLGRAALLHDVGKGEIPGEILHKEGKLTDLEWAEVMAHPMRGATMLEDAGWDDPTCLDVASNHHERCDGSGYPRGLVKEQISPEARIVAITDTFDVLTTNYPHRPGMSGFQALWRMKREMKGYFDPTMLDRFIETMVDPARRR